MDDFWMSMALDAVTPHPYVFVHSSAVEYIQEGRAVPPLFYTGITIQHAIVVRICMDYWSRKEAS